MNRPNGTYPRPGTYPELHPNVPLIRESSDVPSFITKTAWVVFDQIFPQEVSVETGKLNGTAFERFGDGLIEGSWETRRLDVPGWGSVIWAGQVERDQSVRHTSALVVPEADLAEELIGLMVGRMLNLEWMPPAAAAQLGLKRLNGMMAGLAAFVYRTAPELFGGRWPVGDRILSEWQESEGVPVICQAAGLDLRDLSTY